MNSIKDSNKVSILIIILTIFILIGCEPNNETLIAERQDCDQGYHRDDEKCVENIDICADKSKNCSCKETLTSFECRCNFGYTGNGNLAECYDYHTVFQYGGSDKDIATSLAIDLNDNVYLVGEESTNLEEFSFPLFFEVQNNKMVNIYYDFFGEDSSFKASSLAVDKTHNNALYFVGREENQSKIIKRELGKIKWSRKFSANEAPLFVNTNSLNKPLVIGNNNTHSFIQEYQTEKQEKEIEEEYLYWNEVIKNEKSELLENFFPVSVDFDKDNNIYVVGNRYENNINTIIIMKYRNNFTEIDGELNREVLYYETIDDATLYATSMAIDQKENIYITGAKKVNENNSTAFLIQKNINTKKEATVYFDTPSSNATAVKVVTKNNDIYVLGYTDGEYEGNKSRGNIDLFLTKFYSNFDFTSNNNEEKYWHRQIGTELNDIAKDIKIDSKNNIWILGETEGVFNNAIYDTGGDYNRGETDIFLMKIEQ